MHCRLQFVPSDGASCPQFGTSLSTVMHLEVLNSGLFGRRFLRLHFGRSEVLCWTEDTRIQLLSRVSGELACNWQSSVLWDTQSVSFATWPQRAAGSDTWLL